jgi:hypothetical protein
MIQDIEAEDKILGPLTLRQFLFALAGSFLLYMDFLMVAKGVGFLLILFAPPTLFVVFFAIPFGRDQPTEVWALAKIRFFFKPRRRIWDQSGVKELVSITVPKKVERNLTNGLSQHEVKSRLSALANTIDSRGWAVKNVDINLYANPLGGLQNSSDRLIDIASLPREVPEYEVTAADDIMDERSNPIAQQFDHMINESAQVYRQQLVQQMNAPAIVPGQPTPTAPADYWFAGQNSPQSNPFANQTVFSAPTVLTPAQSLPAPPQPPTVAAPLDINEAAFMAKVRADEANEQVASSHLHTLQPLGDQPVAVAPPVATPVMQAASPAPSDPAILSLASNNDLNIATLAREAHKSKQGDGDGEVVISLR